MKLIAFNRLENKYELRLKSVSVSDTLDIAAKLAPLLHGGDVLALRGTLGSGKTIFSKGMALALGITDEVTSPTFTFVSEYSGVNVELYHFDLYRIDVPEQLEDIDFDGYVFGNGISLIEWPEKAGRYLPSDRLEVSIERMEDSTETRLVTLYGETEHYKSLLEEFEKIVDSCD